MAGVKAPLPDMPGVDNELAVLAQIKLLLMNIDHNISTIGRYVQADLSAGGWTKYGPDAEEFDERVLHNAIYRNRYMMAMLDNLTLLTGLGSAQRAQLWQYMLRGRLSDDTTATGVVEGDLYGSGQEPPLIED